MEILETKGRKMNKIKREERENLHTFSDTTITSVRTWDSCSKPKQRNLKRRKLNSTNRHEDYGTGKRLKHGG